MLKYIYLIIGYIFLGLGLVGVVLPVIPTTPFLLVASYCFAKGSERFHNWFCNTQIYYKYLESYIKEREMTLKTKLSILLLSSTTMIIAFFITPILPARIFLAVVIVFHWWYFIFRIKTK